MKGLVVSASPRTAVSARFLFITSWPDYYLKRELLKEKVRTEIAQKKKISAAPIRVLGVGLGMKPWCKAHSLCQACGALALGRDQPKGWAGGLRTAGFD